MNNAAAMQQVEFWVDQDLKVPSRTKKPARTESAEAPQVKEPEPEKIVPKSVVKEKPVRRTSAARLQKKPSGLSMFGIAKFLKINGSVSDGRAGARFLDLPGRANNPRYALTHLPGGTTATFREIRSLPREFGGFVTR